MEMETCVPPFGANDQNEFTTQKPLLVIAMHSFKGRNNDELSFNKNDVISVTQKLDGGWWEGSLNGCIGWFPSDFVGLVNDSSSSRAGDVQRIENGFHVDPKLEAKKSAYRTEQIQTFMSTEMENQQKIGQLLTTLKSLEGAEKMNEFSPIVQNLTEFITLKNAFLMQFEEQSKKPLNCQFIGKLFLEFDLRTILFTYCKRHCDLMDFLNRNNEAVQQQLSSRSIDFREMIIGLSLVFRHVDKYANILQEIERNTPDGHSDKGNLYRASLVYADFYAGCERIRKQREAQIYFMQSQVLEDNFGKDFERALGSFLFIGKVTVFEADPNEQGTEVDRCVAIFGRSLLLVEHCSSTGKNTLRNKFSTDGLSIHRGPTNDEMQLISVSNGKTTQLVLRSIGSEDYKQMIDALRNCKGIRLSHTDKQQPPLINEVRHKPPSDDVVDTIDGAQNVTTAFGNIRLNHQLEMILPDDFSENVAEASVPSILVSKPFCGWSLRPFPPHRAEWLPDLGRTVPVKMRKGLSAEEQEDALMLKIIEGYCLAGTSCATNSHFCGRRAHEQRNSAESFHSPCGGGPVRRAASYPDQHEISVRPQLIVAEDEKLFVEELEGDKFVMKERSLVDTVYSLKDQISVLTKEVSKVAKALEQEQRTRRRLEEMVTRQNSTGTVKATQNSGAL